MSERATERLLSSSVSANCENKNAPGNNHLVSLFDEQQLLAIKLAAAARRGVALPWLLLLYISAYCHARPGLLGSLHPLLFL